jgi:hypothetical protein
VLLGGERGVFDEAHCLPHACFLFSFSKPGLKEVVIAVVVVVVVVVVAAVVVAAAVVVVAVVVVVALV